MAEAEQNFVGNDEQQNFSLQESDQHHLSANDFDHQNFAGDVHGDYSYVGAETENQMLAGNEQSFAGNDPTNYGVVSDQMYPQNENDHAFDGDQGNGLTENESKQEFTGNEANEMDNIPDNSHVQKKAEQGNNLAGGGEKKWPGWPGESVFRMLVPAQKVGNIIGRKGEYIKKIVEETKARIKVLDGPPGSQERAVRKLMFANFKATISHQCHFKHEASKIQIAEISLSITSAEKSFIWLKRVALCTYACTKKLFTVVWK